MAKTKTKKNAKPAGRRYGSNHVIPNGTAVRIAVASARAEGVIRKCRLRRTPYKSTGGRLYLIEITAGDRCDGRRNENGELWLPQQFLTLATAPRAVEGTPTTVGELAARFAPYLVHGNTPEAIIRDLLFGCAFDGALRADWEFAVNAARARGEYDLTRHDDDGQFRLVREDAA